jgi:diguanylate cyclase (GGDEF)-like protein
VARGAAHSQQRLAVLLLDLDGFKSVNDILGHSIGDKLLQRVSKRLVRSVRASDTACRLGGDEFLVLSKAVDEETIVHATAKVRTHLCMPYVIDGFAIEITISMGTATYAIGGEEYESLIRRADFAMYQDKARGVGLPRIRSRNLKRGARGKDTSQGLGSTQQDTSRGGSEDSGVRHAGANPCLPAWTELARTRDNGAVDAGLSTHLEADRCANE